MADRHGEPWTQEEKRFLLDNYEDMTAAEIAEELDRKESAIYSKAHNMRVLDHLPVPKKGGGQ